MSSGATDYRLNRATKKEFLPAAVLLLRSPACGTNQVLMYREHGLGMRGKTTERWMQTGIWIQRGFKEAVD